MKKITVKAIKPYLFIGLFVCLLFTLASFKIGVLKGNVSNQQINVLVQSRVPNITFLEASIFEISSNDKAVRVTFRNDSPKIITAFSVASGTLTNRNELLDTTGVINPGESLYEEFVLTDSTRKGIALEAVVFEDGTTSGRAKYIKQILDARAGKQAQLQRISPIVNDSLVSTQSFTRNERWQTNISKIKNLPESEEGRSFEYNAALQDEKNSILMKAKQVEQIEQERGTDNARQMLTYLKEEYERKKIVWRDVIHKQR
jgi:hypothetical protein